MRSEAPILREDEFTSNTERERRDSLARRRAINNSEQRGQKQSTIASRDDLGPPHPLAGHGNGLWEGLADGGERRRAQPA